MFLIDLCFPVFFQLGICLRDKWRSIHLGSGQTRAILLKGNGLTQTQGECWAVYPYYKIKHSEIIVLQVIITNIDQLTFGLAYPKDSVPWVA